MANSICPEECHERAGNSMREFTRPEARHDFADRSLTIWTADGVTPQSMPRRLKLPWFGQRVHTRPKAWRSSPGIAFIVETTFNADSSPRGLKVDGHPSNLHIFIRRHAASGSSLTNRFCRAIPMVLNAAGKSIPVKPR